MSLPPLVLCPGLDGTGDAFGPIREAAIDRDVGVQIVRYPVGSHACRSVEDHVRVIDQHRAALSSPHLLVAESFSGPLAIRAAADDPPLGLVLVATFRRRPRRWPAWLLRFAGPVAGFATPPKWAIRSLLTGPADAELLQILQDSMVSAREDVPHRLRMVAEHDAGPALCDVDAPILILNGTRDRLVTPADTDDLRGLRPDATARTLDAAHLVLQTAPAAALDAIDQWWSGFTSDSHHGPTGFAAGEDIAGVH